MESDVPDVVALCVGAVLGCLLVWYFPVVNRILRPFWKVYWDIADAIARMLVQAFDDFRNAIWGHKVRGVTKKEVRRASDSAIADTREPEPEVPWWADDLDADMVAFIRCVHYEYFMGDLLVWEMEEEVGRYMVVALTLRSQRLRKERFERNLAIKERIGGDYIKRIYQKQDK